jgi:Amt family ammonium transporter
MSLADSVVDLNAIVGDLFTAVDKLEKEANETSFLLGVGSGDEEVTGQGNANNIWMLFAAFLVFFMHAGFTMLEAGSVRMKNSMNIMFKNVGTMAIGAVLYFLLGFGFAYGEDDGSGFVGTSGFANDGLLDAGKAGMIFQLMFAATAATIVSGTVAGRVSLPAYFIVAAALTAWVYPVISHWIWATGGFYSAFTAPEDTLFGSTDEAACGMIDFAGSGVVHYTGGIAGLIGAYIIGPRLGRFADDGTPNETFTSHNYALVTLGTFILWFGWYGFNCGSTLTFDGILAGKVAVTTTLAPSAAAITGMALNYFLTKTWDLGTILNCVLAGLVSITAGCPVVPNASSILIGSIGACVYIFCAKLMLKLKIDDPVNAVAVHGACGVWGVLAVAIFATEAELANAAYNEVCQTQSFGDALRTQSVGILLITAWVAAHMIPLFLVLKVTGFLRVSEELEMAGLDVSEHGATAYEAADSAAYPTKSSFSTTLSPVKMEE